MSKPIYLKIETNDGVITIPFLGMKEVDDFTVLYRNMGELVSSLIKFLQLPIELYDVADVYLTYYKYNRKRDDDCFSIKYQGDNFNKISLQEAFVTYLKDDLKRIFTSDIRYVKTEGILNYYGTGMISTYDLERAVLKFFAEGTGYKRMRDTYFLIKDSVRVGIDWVPEATMEGLDRRDLSTYSTGEDNHLNYLIELSKKGEEEFDKAMDEIGQADLEEIRGLLRSGDYGIVDGASSDYQTLNSKRKRMSLEENTGISIADLRENHVVYSKSRRRKL